MIQVLAQGRLGNQMFQYAFGYVASKKLKTRSFMRGTILPEFFELDAPRWVHVARTNILFAFMRLSRPRRVMTVDNLTPPHQVLAQLQDHVVYSVYFQSAEFLTGYGAKIQKLFTVLPAHRKTFLTRYGELVTQCKTIAVHIRSTDYTDFPLFGIQGSVLLPFAYFRACLARIQDLEQYKLIFVSDEMDVVQSEFRDLKMVPEWANPGTGASLSPIY